MKKIAYLSNDIYFEIYKKICDKISKDNNLDLVIEYIDLKEFSKEYVIDNYDAIYSYNFFENEFEKNFFIKNISDHIAYNLFSISISHLLEKYNKLFNFSNVVILENTFHFNSIYNILKDKNIKNIYLVNSDILFKEKIKKNVKNINYNDLKKIENIDIIFNITGLGNLYSLETTPFVDDKIHSKLAIDINILPIETTFLLKMKSKNSTIISGLEIIIIEILNMFSIIYKKDNLINDEIIKELFEYMKEIINFKNFEVLENQVSKEYIKMLRIDTNTDD